MFERISMCVFLITKCECPGNTKRSFKRFVLTRPVFTTGSSGSLSTMNRKGLGSRGDDLHTEPVFYFRRPLDFQSRFVGMDPWGEEPFVFFLMKRNKTFL